MGDKGKLYFCVGTPRGGKSTLCDQWVRRRDDQTWRDDLLNRYRSVIEDNFKAPEIHPRVIIAGDNFRTALYGEAYKYEAECMVFAAMDVATRALLLRGFDVIIDETCTTEQTLYRYLKIDLDAKPIFIDTPVEVCLERAMVSGKWYLDGPIKAMAKQLKSLRANWDETYCRLRRQIIERYPTQYSQQEREHGSSLTTV